MLELSLTLFPDLKELIIRACPLVTQEGLRSVLALPFLQHLDYCTSRPVSKSFVREIAAQNPSRETISVQIEGDVDNRGPKPLDINHFAWTPEEKRDFLRKHPRIKELNIEQPRKHSFIPFAS